MYLQKEIMFGQYYIDEECGKGNVCEIDYDINIIDYDKSKKLLFI